MTWCLWPRFCAPVTLSWFYLEFSIKVGFSAAVITASVKPCIVIVLDILFKHTLWPGALDLDFALQWLCQFYIKSSIKVHFPVAMIAASVKPLCPLVTKFYLLLYMLCSCDFAQCRCDINLCGIIVIDVKFWWQAIIFPKISKFIRRTTFIKWVLNFFETSLNIQNGGTHSSWKLLRIKVTPDLHLTYSKNGGNLGLVLKMKNIACLSIILTKRVKYTYLYLFYTVL